MSARLALAFAAVVAGFAALVVLLVPAPGSSAPAAHAATVVTPAPVAEAHAGGTAVSSTLDAGQLAPADAAFLADLFEGSTDYTPEEALFLTEIGHRYCTFVVEGQIVPGAEVQTRDGYLASLTAAGDPHALTLDEATKLLDVSEAAYCPQPAAQVVSAPVTRATAPSPAAPRTTASPEPVVEQPAPTATAAPSTADEQVQEQLPEEAIGGARCGDTTQVVVALDADGLPVCG